MEKEITLLQALTGVDFVFEHLDGTKIRVQNKPGEVIKPDDIKTLKDKKGNVILYYTVHESGSGTDAPKAGTQCDCHYKGTLIDGNEFDSSYKRGEPTEFAPNQVIKGWTEAMQLMVEGDKWEMYIPSELGYGDTGSGENIKGGDVLVFRMEILEILGGKVRAVKCDLKTRENCDEDEVKILDDWAKKSKDEVEAEVNKLKKKTSEVLKKR